MAYTTEKSYTQNGNTNRDFTVTFPFLATTDIRVQLNGVTKTLTSDYTIVQGSGSTVVNFNTAPSNGNTIRLFRDTAIDDMQATFAAGSSIRSTDLNTNNTQLLYAAQEFGTLPPIARRIAKPIAKPKLFDRRHRSKMTGYLLTWAACKTQHAVLGGRKIGVYFKTTWRALANSIQSP